MRYPNNGLQRALDTDIFMGRVMAAARLVLSCAVGLTPTERERLRDVAKGRYEFLTQRQCQESAAKCENFAARTAFSEAFRGYELAIMPDFARCPVETYVLNTDWQAKGDIAQARFLVDRSRPNRDHAIHTLAGEFETLRIHRDAILRESAERRALVVVR
jgi:hypothetical protein